MDRTDSNKVLTHINEAKNWLDEATEEYTQSNRIRGEINLNLAQAEVKYAWELSRRQNVTQNGQVVPARRVVNYFPAAAAVFIVLGLTGGFYWFVQNVKTGTPALTTQNYQIAVKKIHNSSTDNPPTTKANSTVKATVANSDGVLSVERDNQLQNAPSSDPQIVSVKPALKIVKTQEAKKPRTLETTEGKKASTPTVAVDKTEKLQKADHNDQIMASENRTSASVASNAQHVVREERDFAPNVSKLSVVSLVIDEEALTKEASYSLKNGK